MPAFSLGIIGAVRVLPEPRRHGATGTLTSLKGTRMSRIESVFYFYEAGNISENPL